MGPVAFALTRSIRPEPAPIRCVKVSAVGICGSDLHTYEDARMATLR
jgi:threonine dehydrogenase-like Zn-dependent dehydrogenase